MACRVRYVSDRQIPDAHVIIEPKYNMRVSTVGMSVMSARETASAGGEPGQFTKFITWVSPATHDGAMHVGSCREGLMRKVLLLVGAAACVASIGIARGQGQSSSAAALPQPTFHHIHINSVNPDQSLAWYSQYWPKGKKTTYAGFPAFSDEKGFYLL